MKKLLLAVALISPMFSGCYKEYDIDYRAILTEHKWYLKTRLVNNENLTRYCDLTDELTFNDDSTGSYYNATPCDTVTPTTRSFKWFMSYDETTIHFSEMTNSPNTWGVFRIQYLDDENLRINGALGGVTYMEVYSYKR